MTEENGSLSRLPIGWVWTEMQHTSETTSGGTPTRSKKEYFGGNIPWLKSGELNNQVINSSEESITREGLENSSAKIVPKGALLIALYGATVGKLGILGIDAAINQAICTILPYEGISCKFLFWYLRQHRNELLNIRKGGAQPNISQDVVKHIPVPIAPFPEQCRIVARLEELFTRLDAGVEGLRKTRAQLKRYRQAVLKYAFEGKLTEEWRKTHNDQIEPATKLLERIREVRKNTKSTELQPMDTSDLPTLPEKWTWARIGEITDSMRNGVYKPKKFYDDSGVACLRMYNIENGAIVWKDVKRMRLTPQEIEFYELRPGDILVNRVNSRELVGKAAEIPSRLERCVYESKNIRLRLLRDYANSKYVNFWFLMYSQKFFSRNAQQTVGMASINQEQIASMPMPLCHLDEQIEAVERIERLFSVADKVEQIATESIEHADKMRQSILKMAFEGRLVPQDPSDEPADRLLERVEAEREMSEGKKGTNRRSENKPKQFELSAYVE